MPELPEAETIARQLDRGLAGKTLGKVHLTRPDIVHGEAKPLDRWLPGRKVIRVYRRAKRVVVELGPRADLVFCLGMTGRLTLCSPDVEIAKHTHFRVVIRKSDTELRFQDPRRFGGIWCRMDSNGQSGGKLSELGPEPLDLTPARFYRLLNRSRQIKAALMDQRFIAGLGNIYCDEALYAARVHPLSKTDSLDRDTSDRLLRAVKSTLRSAIRHGGSTLMDYRTTTGDSGSFQNRHRVYQKEGEPCRTCHAPIERIKAAGRSTFLCPRCQRQIVAV